MSCAMRDSCFEVSGHAHAEQAEPIAARDLGQQREMWRGVFLGRRYAHQADQRQPPSRPHFVDEAVRFLWSDAGLLRLQTGVDLNEADRSFSFLLHRGGQRLGTTRSVEGLNRID